MIKGQFSFQECDAVSSAFLSRGSVTCFPTFDVQVGYLTAPGNMPMVALASDPLLLMMHTLSRSRIATMRSH